MLHAIMRDPLYKIISTLSYLFFKTKAWRKEENPFCETENFSTSLVVLSITQSQKLVSQHPLFCVLLVFYTTYFW